MPALAPKWEAVALALAGGDSHRIAYIAGGYKYNRAGAHRLCTKPEIQERANEIRQERAEIAARARQEAAKQAGYDEAWWDQHVKIGALGALRGDPVRDATGRKKRDPETGEIIYRPDRAAAARFFDLMGRRLGIFIDRAEIGGPGDFARLSDAELQAKLVELGNALGVPEDVVKRLEWKPQEAAE